MRNLTPSEVRRSGNPNIVGSLVVECPSDNLRMSGRSELRGKRGAHHLLDSEGLCEGCCGCCQKEKRQDFESFHEFSGYQLFKNLA
jgi:hypothetical protein